MAEGYMVELELLADIILKAAPPTSSLTWEEKGLHLLLAIAERLERLADKPLGPVLANLAQLVEALYGIGAVNDLARRRLLETIERQEVSGGEHR